MVGPIIRLEWLLRRRRDRFQPLLSCYVFCLVLDGCAFYYRGIAGRDSIFLPPTPGRSGRFVAAAVEFLWYQQWLLPFLVGPPFVANALAVEKANGALALLFTTPVTRCEIILGKFLGRVVPLLLLGVAHWPFWGLLAALVGLDPLSALLLGAAALLPTGAVSAASVLASVWCRQTADAIVALYALFAVAIVGMGVMDAAGVSWLSGLLPCSPDYLLEPVWDSRGNRELGGRVLTATAAWGAITAGCLGLACRRLRPTSMDQPIVHRTPLRRPAVTDEPIHWKERYRESRMPLAFVRFIPTWLTLLGLFVGTACSTLWILGPSGTSLAELTGYLRTGDVQTLSNQLGTRGQPARPALLLGLLLGLLLLAALAVGVRCATAVSGERERRTWELLLLTPLSTGELLHDKLRGIVQSTWPYLAVSALAAGPLVWLAGWAELMLTLVSLILARPSLSVAGAIGIYQSARAANSWQSILATVRGIIGGTLFTAFITYFVVGCVGLAFLGLGSLIEDLTGRLPFLEWLGMEHPYLRLFHFLVLFGLSWMLFCGQLRREYLAKAQAWIDSTERTPRAQVDDYGTAFTP